MLITYMFRSGYVNIPANDEMLDWPTRFKILCDYLLKFDSDVSICHIRCELY
jgi:hypothetical protein